MHVMVDDRSARGIASPPRCVVACALAALATAAGSSSAAENGADDAADIAMKLNNPIASLVSVPMQLNYDRGIGSADDGNRWVLNVQPVIPIGLNVDWNLISRTIVPLTSQNDVPPGIDESGLGDVLQSLFFSPKAPTARAGSGAWAQRCCCPPQATICWDPRNGQPGRQPWC
jgi:hypothetical protein